MTQKLDPQVQSVEALADITLKPSTSLYRTPALACRQQPLGDEDTDGRMMSSVTSSVKLVSHAAPGYSSKDSRQHASAILAACYSCASCREGITLASRHAHAATSTQVCPEAFQGKHTHSARIHAGGSAIPLVDKPQHRGNSNPRSPAAAPAAMRRRPSTGLLLRHSIIQHK